MLPQGPVLLVLDWEQEKLGALEFAERGASVFVVVLACAPATPPDWAQKRRTFYNRDLFPQDEDDGGPPTEDVALLATVREKILFHMQTCAVVDSNVLSAVS